MLNFPNPNRSFDATRNRVRFWGYDRALEISFFVEADALQKLSPEMITAESGFLTAFDASRKQIYEAADYVYVHGGRKGSYAYSLTAKDF